jgi:ATP-dependent DNA ligase
VQRPAKGSEVTKATTEVFDLSLEIEPMEARSADSLPAGDGWQYEPKWDGFRSGSD